MLAVQKGTLIVLRDSSASTLFRLQCCRGQSIAVVTMAVIMPHGAVAVVIIIMSLWPYHPHAIGDGDWTAKEEVTRKKKKESIQRE